MLRGAPYTAGTLEYRYPTSLGCRGGPWESKAACGTSAQTYMCVVVAASGIWANQMRFVRCKRLVHWYGSSG